MILTPKQKAYLRSLAQTDKAKFQCGKDGLSNTFIELIQNAFHTRELLKIHVLKGLEVDLKELAFDIARYTKSEVVQIIGRQIVLYKPMKTPRIGLPK
ncbi:MULTISPECIES: YhbY family RNA-binding protein [Terrabacteria group]|uniref:YhbY family RNA-binding protein n=1 Tax=Bacillati TaxID=1783272 RepID=UPI0019396529|nr:MULTISPECIES: YhbY family RNA-binding protein [Terrabacteria group]MBW9212091.1 YhbY family RNA-binding protein [Trueperella sp. zg.1013]QRG87103.1 YhbY family RNA-binding protein [Bulleidia sp. zg-1006]